MYSTLPKISNNIISLSPDLDIANTISRNHFAIVPSQNFNFSQIENTSCEKFVKGWDTLKQDPYMSDNGNYRLRRYGTFIINQVSLKITYQPDSTFYQSLKTNPLNGGIKRKFSRLLKPTTENCFLHALIRLDFKNLPSTITSCYKFWKIGVHQIKIRSFPGSSGDPTPEGIHRDEEVFTVQHLIQRHNIDFGENLFYGSGEYPSQKAKTRLMQKDFFDSYYFDNSIWHSVTPIESLDRVHEGYRNVLLLDFVPDE